MGRRVATATTTRVAIVSVKADCSTFDDARAAPAVGTARSRPTGHPSPCCYVDASRRDLVLDRTRL